MLKELFAEIDLTNELSKFIFILCMVTIVITLLISFFSRNHRWVKYLPGLTILFVGLYKFLVLGFEILSKENLSELTLVMILGIISIVSLCTAILFGIVAPKRKKVRRKKVIKENEA